MGVMDGNYSHLITGLRYLNDGLAPLTHSGVDGYSDQSHHNNSLQWPMLLMLQRLSIFMFLSYVYVNILSPCSEIHSKFTRVQNINL